MMTRYFRYLLLAAALLAASFLRAADTFTLLSWNIRDLGQSKDDAEIRFIATQMRHADIVALQEVVAGPGGAQAVARLAGELNRMGARWDYRVSDPTDSPPYYTERYAFLWKTSRAQLLGRPALERRLAEQVAREPYVARFRVNGRELLIVNFHAVPWNKNPEAEVQYLELFPQWYPGLPLLIAGDFNLGESHEVFRRFTARRLQPALRGQATTVRRKNGFETGEYLLHAIDNIFHDVARFRLEAAGIIDFVAALGDLEAANRVSDHVPVWIKWQFLPGD